jgi:uncharacterized protein (DUF427 family)
MSTIRQPVIPGPDHPIDITPFKGRVTVTSNGRTIADTTAALELREASYPPVRYLPLTDVDETALRPSNTLTYCPYKGDASYYDVVDPATQESVKDAVWHYREPYPSVAEIADHVAFYTNRVDVNVRPADVELEPANAEVEPANVELEPANAEVEPANAEVEPANR